MFALIAEMNTPDELDTVLLQDITHEDLDAYKTKSYENIWNNIYGGNK